jgi:hypothetical protein
MGCRYLYCNYCFSQSPARLNVVRAGIVNDTYYLTHITVVDVVNGRLSDNMTVVISDSIISDIGPTRKIKRRGKAKVINCKGKYIISRSLGYACPFGQRNIFCFARVYC